MAQAGDGKGGPPPPASALQRAAAVAVAAVRVAAPIVAAGVLLIALDPYTMAAYRAIAPRGEWAIRLAEACRISLALPVVVVFIAVYVLLIRGERWRRLAVLAGTMLSQALFIEVLKRVFSRPRPLELADRVAFYGPQWHAAFKSFPGGHACAAVALATVLAALHPKGKWAFYAGALLVIWSRIHLNAHFVGDCWFGGWLGFWVARAWVNGGLTPRPVSEG